MDESRDERALGDDLSAGTEAFREDLLARCLSVLAHADDGAVLDDDELELLADAGMPNTDIPPSLAGGADNSLN